MGNTMATKKKGLGRGLNALLGGTENVAAMTTVQHEDELRELAIDLIRFETGNGVRSRIVGRVHRKHRPSCGKEEKHEDESSDFGRGEYTSQSGRG